jgi:3-hydroxymyristoyl/3-hydroxydecanoyl-(acyl carrier protein) dehydratase
MNRIYLNAQEKYLSVDALTTRRLVPHRFPMLLLDRVKGFYYEEQRCLSIKVVSQNDPVLPGHFPGFPIYPGALSIEALAQNAGMAVMLQDRLQAVGSIEGVVEWLTQLPEQPVLSLDNVTVLAESRIKHMSPVYPGSVIELEASLSLQRAGMAVYKVCARVDGLEVSKGQLTMARLPAAMLGRQG